MHLKHRLTKLETATQKTKSTKVLYYVVNEQTLAEAKAARGWQNVPDNQLKIITYRVIE